MSGRFDWDMSEGNQSVNGLETLDIDGDFFDPHRNIRIALHCKLSHTSGAGGGA